MEGDDKVATCTDCHGDHGILPAIDPRSPVYPANVPNTCGQCHSDADYMAEYGIPTNQLEEYRRSVHGKPLLERHDMSAPACNDCHGNHGATPPGVSSLANVCGQCHPVNNDLVNQSSHRPAFEHLGIAACKTCHSHHDIRPPTDEMVGTSGAAVCVQCHSPEVRAVTLAAGTGAVTDAGLERGWQAAATMRSSLDSLRIAHAEAEGLVRRAERAGMSVEDALYDLHESQGRLTRARSVLHAFQTEQVVETSQEGLDLAAQAHQRGLQALDDLDYRRRGLALSLLVIAVVGTALYAKIRSLDHDESPAQRRQRGGE
jgi:predicted CXXCH cytochrome family protein